MRFRGENTKSDKQRAIRNGFRLFFALVANLGFYVEPNIHRSTVSCPYKTSARDRNTISCPYKLHSGIKVGRVDQAVSVTRSHQNWIFGSSGESSSSDWGTAKPLTLSLVFAFVQQAKEPAARAGRPFNKQTVYCRGRSLRLISVYNIKRDSTKQRCWEGFQTFPCAAASRLKQPGRARFTQP